MKRLCVLGEHIFDKPACRCHVHQEHKTGFSMKLGILLHLVGLNRNTFNTMNRRTPLRFMERNLLDDRSYDRYTFTHAVAVGCVVELMNAGLPANRASSVVDATFDFIDAAVDEFSKNISSNNWWLTVTNFADGSYGWAGGQEDARPLGDQMVLSKLTINIEAVWQSMSQRIGTTRDPSNKDD
ncbi:hypothetical protein [Sphingomonas sp. SORGH_AS_0879]|uniref:hypothetical protein n=1 Tax=Sphingomonas sp. SORGH_AS_0879 TaxID=3041790 RepID=UPI0027892741|nr:hypothetical protein [Sphingomonas sp. SORGH_AS_0879]MDQ1232124.1 hypothetical protein [Sphingomonas sp. SORGH_AS_0879]